MRTTKGISLQWLLPGSIVLSLILLLSIVFYQGQRGLEAARVSAANDTAMQLGNVVNERVGRLINPVESTIRLLAHDPLGAADSLQLRLQRLPLLIEALEANSMLSAAYIGYASGEFLLVRPLARALPQNGYDAPAEADYLVQAISLDEHGELRGNWLFYGAQLQLLESRAMPDYRFDPRSRPWYRTALKHEGPLLTRPYVFFTTREVGITVALASLAGEAIIGLDASVDDLSGE
ncbi:MAG: phosphohydrolase, partial [Pseudomonas sp.]